MKQVRTRGPCLPAFARPCTLQWACACAPWSFACRLPPPLSLRAVGSRAPPFGFMLRRKPRQRPRRRRTRRLRKPPKPGGERRRASLPLRKSRCTTLLHKKISHRPLCEHSLEIRPQEVAKAIAEAGARKTTEELRRPALASGNSAADAGGEVCSARRAALATFGRQLCSSSSAAACARECMPAESLLNAVAPSFCRRRATPHRFPFSRAPPPWLVGLLPASRLPRRRLRSAGPGTGAIRRISM